MSSWARRYIQTTLTFLTTLVKKSDKNDWVKLKRVLKYLKGERKLNLSLIIGDTSVVKLWVDGFYAVYKDCQGHTGSMMSLVKIVMSILSTNPKINWKIYTEDDLIGVYKDIEKLLWSRNSMDVQGYNIAYNKLFQDNNSAILLEKMVKYPVSNVPSTSRLDISSWRTEWHKLTRKYNTAPRRRFGMKYLPSPSKAEHAVS